MSGSGSYAIGRIHLLRHSNVNEASIFLSAVPLIILTYFKIKCERYHINGFKLFLNGKKNAEFNGACQQTSTLTASPRVTSRTFTVLSETIANARSSVFTRYIATRQFI